MSFYVEAGNNKEVPASHFRAPAYPLITIDPYISAWSHTDKLYEDDVRHWTGTEHPLVGVLRVDGKCYRFMGKDKQVLKAILKDARNEEWQAKYTNTLPLADWYKKSIMMWDGRQVWGHLEVLICLTLKPDGARGIFGYAGNSQSIIKMLSRKSYI